MKVKLARGLLAVAGLLLFADAALHGTLGYAALSKDLEGKNLRPFIDSAVRAFWLLGSWHWIGVAVIALLVAFKESAAESPLGRAIVLLGGLIVLGDTVATVTAAGLFFGNITLGAASLLLLAAFAVLANSASPRT